MAMRIFSSSSPPPPLFQNTRTKPQIAALFSFSLRLRRARAVVAAVAAAAAAAAAAAGGPERDAARCEGEEVIGAGLFDRGMAEIAKKIPLFEPGRGETAAAGTAGARPLPINLELWLHRAKVHTREFEFTDAEKLLNKVHK